MSQLEKERASCPAPQEELIVPEPFNVSPNLRVYLLGQLKDLRDGFEYRGDRVGVELASQIVDSHINHLEEALSQVSKPRKVNEKPIYFDHPTLEDSYLSRAKKELGDVDYALLDFTYRRCLYSLACYAVGLGIVTNAPNTAEQLTRFEWEFLQDTKKIDLVDNSLHLTLSCRVNPVKVVSPSGERETLERRWVVEPGRNLGWESNWQRMFGEHFKELPDPEDLVITRSVDKLRTEDILSSIATVTYCDEMTGKRKKAFTISFDREFSPAKIDREIREYSYRDIIYYHPVTDEKIGAEEEMIKIWRATDDWTEGDSKRGFETRVLVHADYSRGDELPRKVEKCFEVSYYHPYGSNGSRDRVWLEQTREVFRPEGTVTYRRSDLMGIMCLPDGVEPSDLLTPRELGEPKVFYFI